MWTSDSDRAKWVPTMGLMRRGSPTSLPTSRMCATLRAPPAAALARRPQRPQRLPVGRSTSPRRDGPDHVASRRSAACRTGSCVQDGPRPGRPGSRTGMAVEGDGDSLTAPAASLVRLRAPWSGRPAARMIRAEAAVAALAPARLRDPPGAASSGVWHRRVARPRRAASSGRRGLGTSAGPRSDAAVGSSASARVSRRPAMTRWPASRRRSVAGHPPAGSVSAAPSTTSTDADRCPPRCSATPRAASSAERIHRLLRRCSRRRRTGPRPPTRSRAVA